MEEKEIKKSSIDQLNQIRSMMEESSRFISLSGLSGILAGLTALAGSAYAHFIINISMMNNRENGIVLILDKIDISLLTHLTLTAAAVLFIALSFGIILTVRKAKKKGQSIWGSTSRRLAINMAIPLGAGGVFCFVLFQHGLIGLIAPATLLFYGLALINASKYTLSDVRYLGLFEIALGLLSSYFIGYGLLFWAIGFGILHIVYGSLMYFKYDRV